MAKYRNKLPQMNGDFFMTDGGIETTLIFLEGEELPYFAAFHLFKTPGGEAVGSAHPRPSRQCLAYEPRGAGRGSRPRCGRPSELGQEYAHLRKQQLKHLNVMGGCCGTDHRHVEQIASACLPLFREAT